MNPNSFSDAYAKAGVDLAAGYRAVGLMKAHVARTKTDGVVDDIGGFGGLYRLPNGDILVSGTDGVGTKLELAKIMGKHNTVGIDLVAMCANDVVCTGANPLFFLDYIACGKNIPEKIAMIVGGIADGCVQAGCALIGGETAEHPGVMEPNDYDLAGFVVGLAHESEILDKNNVRSGDAIIGLKSSGVHSNGFSLVRRIFDIDNKGLEALNRRYAELGGDTLGNALLEPTVIYVKAIQALRAEGIPVHSIAHITGGGFYENIPRALPDGLTAHIDRCTWQLPGIFRLIASKGGVSEREMFNVFNMGIGMVLTVPAAHVCTALEVLHPHCKSCVIGEVIESDEGVVIN